MDTDRHVLLAAAIASELIQTDMICSHRKRCSRSRIFRQVCARPLALRCLLIYTRHAGRKKITADDVMLLSRRNEGLESVLRTYLDDLNAEPEQHTSAPAKRGRKKA